MSQQYKNHIRWYPAHHFVFYPVAIILAGVAISQAIKGGEQRLLWLFLAAVVFLVAWLSFMLRQHYSLINQNRTVRLEMRFRYYVLTQQRFEPLEEQLSFGQIAALRFASDWELPSLVQKAIREKLSPDQIKQSIVDWLPDLMRV
jgi:hypothetical protein